MTVRSAPWPAGTPCWVDLGVTDIAAATGFYREVLNWTFHDLGPDFGGYQIAQTRGHAAAAIGPVTSTTVLAWLASKFCGAGLTTR